MIAQLKSAGFGGVLGASIPLSDAVLSHGWYFGVAIDLADVMKFALAFAGIIWAASRTVQKFNDRLDALQETQATLKTNQGLSHTEMLELHKAIREVQKVCVECMPKKPKTELKPVPTPTTPLP
jgi:hypothetical protein